MKLPSFSLVICSALKSTMHEHVLSPFSVQFFAIPGTVALQAPLSMGFSMHETGVGCHALLQRILLTRDQTRISFISHTGKQVLYHYHHCYYSHSSLLLIRVSIIYLLSKLLLLTHFKFICPFTFKVTSCRLHIVELI